MEIIAGERQAESSKHVLHFRCFIIVKNQSPILLLKLQILHKKEVVNHCVINELPFIWWEGGCEMLDIKLSRPY